MEFNGPIALNVTFVVKQPEIKDELLVALKNDQDGTYKDEVGSLQFVIGIDNKQDDNNDTIFIHLHEQYCTLSDLDIHCSMEYFKPVVAFIENGSCDITINKYQCTHTIGDKVMNRPGVFCLNVESIVKPEYRNEFIELMKTHQEQTQAEPKCIQFDWGESIDTPNTFHQHEQFVDEDGFHYHELTEHFQKFVLFNSKNPYSAPQTVQKFRLL